MDDIGNIGMPEGIINSDKQKKAKELEKISRILSIFEIIFSFAYFIFSINSGFSVWLRDYVQSYTSIWFFQISLFILIFFAIPSIITFPLGFYEGYILEKKNGLLKQSLGGWFWDEIKKLFLGIVIGLPLTAGIYLALEWQGDKWWIFISICYVFISIIAMFVVPVIIMPMFAKYTPVDDKNLLETLSEIANKSGTKIEGIFRWGLGEKSTQANAALTGFGKTRRIIISDTMLDNYSKEEIETVLAHEFGHHVNKDIFRMLIMGTVATTFSLYICNIVLKNTSILWGLKGLSDFANLPLLMIVMSFISLITMPLVNGYSRKREFEADLYSFKITKKPLTFSRALEKLANQNLSDATPSKLVEFIFYSHPSIENRIKFAEKFASEYLK